MDRTSLRKVKFDMHAMRKWSLPVAFLLTGFALSASAADYQNSPQVAEFISEMTRDYGFADEQLTGVFAEVERKQSILDAISRPAERVKPWKEYRPIFLTQSRIQRGVEFWQKHADTLAQAEQIYGVPAEIIVSIIGVETFYGRNTGSYRVMDALSTLGFDYPPRSDFFRKELREFLLLAREQQVDPLSLTGSYAGAMGLPQFMPSSFRAYAVDFNEDGHINIWNDPQDAIGSVANYFKRHGWTMGEPVVVKAKLSDEEAEQAVTQGIEPTMTLAELKASGWQIDESLDDAQKVTAIRFEGEKGVEYWIGLPNFYVITRYNRSAMYAMAVQQLATEIARVRGVR